MGAISSPNCRLDRPDDWSVHDLYAAKQRQTKRLRITFFMVAMPPALQGPTTSLVTADILIIKFLFRVSAIGHKQSSDYKRRPINGDTSLEYGVLTVIALPDSA